MNLRIFVSIFTAFLFSGCAVFTGHGDKIAKFDYEISRGICDTKDYAKMVAKNDDKIFAANSAGSIARNCKNYEESNYFFDIAEGNYKTAVDERNLFVKGLNEIVSSFTNDNILDYNGKFYERIMTNLYKALNFMNLGEFDNARVEFNRILERQEIAKRHFMDDILAAAKTQPNYTDETGRYLYSANSKNINEFLNFYENSYSNLKASSNFVNPFASYLAGIFFLCDGSYAKGADLLKEVSLIMPKNGQIKKDLAYANSLANSLNARNSKRRVWVIYENGRGAGLKESGFSFPFIIDRAFMSLNVALPVLKKRNTSYEFLQINGAKTTQITDMNEIIAAEFKATANLRANRQIFLGISKVILEYQLSQHKEGAAFGAIYAMFNILSNRADIRYWSYLPANFQSASFENKNGLNLQISGDNGEKITNSQIPPNKNAIIYIKSLQRNLNYIDTIIF